MAKPKRKECVEATLACATKATPVFGPDGDLWLIWSTSRLVLVSRSADLGKTFAPPVAVTPEPQQLDWGPDARPKLVIDRDGRLHATFAIFKDKAFNGQSFHTTSTDGGKTFASPRPLTADPESQRFETAAVDADGRVLVAWLDKRGRPAAKARGEKFFGAALAVAWIGGPDAAIGETRIVREPTCECCRIAVAFAAPGKPAMIFRNIFEGSVRDHAVVTFADPSTPGPVQRVAADEWKTDACPHHGPSLSIGPDKAYHVTWFTQGSARQGLFYARSTDGGATFSTPLAIGDSQGNPAHAFVLALEGRTWLTWKEFDGTATVMKVMLSRDSGVSWSAAREIARTASDSDHPLLIARGAQAYASWLTEADGYRLMALEDAS